MTASSRCGLGAGLVAALLGPVFLIAGSPAARAGALDADRVRTADMISAYERAEGWPVKALALLSLGERWHPDAARILVDAFQSRDTRLRAYALEALRGTAQGERRTVLTKELLDELVREQLREKSPRFRLNLLLFLGRTLPEAPARSPEDWRRWWSATREGYTPPPWQDRPPPVSAAEEETKTVPATAVTRAFDLAEAGLQLVLVIDTTGSMQPTIDAVKSGLRDVVGILSGIARDLELGLVQYRDHEDFPDRDPREAGADVSARLSRNVGGVERRLDRLTAAGGGDMPERIASGLWLAYQRDMGWKDGANKMVIVIGDAPPQESARAVDLARQAYRHPEEFLGGRRVVTGRPSAELRPLITSAVAVGPRGPAGVTSAAFRRIAGAGGGAYVPFATEGPSRDIRAAVVRRFVELSFGSRHAAAARRLADVYLLYRDAGFIDD